MARRSNRDTAAKRNPRRLDTAGGQKRGKPPIWENRTIADAFALDVVRQDGRYFAAVVRATLQELLQFESKRRDTRIALRRKLNGDTR